MASDERSVRDDVVTEALRELRRSALRCRRARVLLDADGLPKAPAVAVLRP